MAEIFSGILPSLNGMSLKGNHSDHIVEHKEHAEPTPPHLSNGSLRVPNVGKRNRGAHEPLTLPPGIDIEKFQLFIERARQICGDEHVTVVSDLSQLSHEHYTDPSKVHDMHNVVDKDYFVSSAVLCPSKVPDVQDIIRLCNEFEIPAWPFSIGRK